MLDGGTGSYGSDGIKEGVALLGEAARKRGKEASDGARERLNVGGEGTLVHRSHRGRKGLGDMMDGGNQAEDRKFETRWRAPTGGQVQLERKSLEGRLPVIAEVDAEGIHPTEQEEGSSLGLVKGVGPTETINDVGNENVMMKDQDEAKREDGRRVVEGTIELTRARRPCGLLIGERIDWIWTARLLGYSPEYVLTRRDESERFRPILKKLLPGAIIQSLTDATDLPAISTWFVDGFVDPSVGSRLSRVAEVVITTKQRRRGALGSGWTVRRTSVAHADVGGVSDAFDRCYLFTKGHVSTDPLDVTVPTLPRRDVYCVASDTVGGSKCEAPLELRLTTPTVTKVGSGYHAGGLYPVGESKPTFRLRSVYYHTGWCQRPLTWSEQASVFDLPLDVVSQIGGGPQVRSLCIHPSKGLEHCCRALLKDAGLHCSGQEARSLAHEYNSVRARTPRPEDIVGHTARAWLEPREDVPPGGRARARKPFTVGGDPLLTTSGSRSELRSTLQEKQEDRNAKATKDDDAEVPVWLWNSAILDGLDSSPLDRGYSEDQVAEALDRFRNWGLWRFFKRGITKSFCNYAESLRPTGFRSSRHTIRVETEYEGPLPRPRYKWTNRLKRFCSTNQPVARYVWTKHGHKEYRIWWQGHWGGLQEDTEPARDAITRAAESSWWEWEIGSAPFFWRWPETYVHVIRDGLEVWMAGKAPRFLRPQKAVRDKDIRDKIVKKISKVRKRKYIAPHHVVSLTDFFHVAKGDNDIRMVYNGTSSGLNNALWVPSFPLPTVDGLLRCVHPSSWMADTDLGEMFLNFHLHKKLRELAGVDVTHYLTQEEEDAMKAKGHGKNNGDKGFGTVWEAWTSCAMGLKPSPYQTTQAMQFVEDVARGDRHRDNNIFQWDRVVLNLPGREEYDPSLPWVYKVQRDGSPANDFLFYVDDNRTVGVDKKAAWTAARRVASICTYLGIQDAPRKRREPSKTPGAWAGAMISTDDRGVYIATSQEKWDKAKSMIQDLKQKTTDHPDSLDRKDLERKRGFLLYVTRSYPATVPYLKGLHLTIDGWRAGRDPDGWRFVGKEAREAQEEGESIDAGNDGWGPPTVKAKPRLIHDLEALMLLFDHASPPHRRIRSKKVIEVYYGFGDASQDGFGFTVQPQAGGCVQFRFGQWCDEVSEASSNYRELLNLVNTLENLVREKDLQGAEVFFFTDNSTAEAVYYKGNSSSQELFELVVRLRQLEMEGDLILHVIHVSGTRMQEEGADGASRGDSSTGVMGGDNMLTYVPLHKGALEVAPELLTWFNGWWDKERGPLRVMGADDWFERPFAGGNCLWAPPPAAAEAAVEQLGRIIHQHPHSCHLFVVPRLMTSRWRRKIGKLMDFECRISAGASVWSKDRHEPLLIFCCLPLSSHSPWKLRGTPFVEKLDGKLRKMHSTHSMPRGSVLRQLFVTARKLESMQEGVVRELLHSPAGLPVSH